jgi:hypothetical protein
MYESEPRRRPSCWTCPMWCSRPMAGWSPEAVQSSVDQFLANVEASAAAWSRRCEPPGPAHNRPHGNQMA